MGVFLRHRPAFRSGYRLPHARGGVSSALSSVMFSTSSSPRPWGCFRRYRARVRAGHVFPTPVGVFPYDAAFAATIGGLPHARWGVSGHPPAGLPLLLSSPRPWGCFLLRQTPCQLTPVFPTPVGVFPRLWRSEMARSSLPYTRGGVSIADGTRFAAVKSSPRPWGCF